MMPPDTVAAVVVTHDPDERFTRLIEALIDQVDTIWIVDNGSQASILEGVVGLAGQSDDRIILIPNLENHGLAAAQNQGITAALEARPSWILLMDHDSIPAPNMVREMLLAARAYPAPEKIGFMVPRHDDDRGFPSASVFTYRSFRVLRWGTIEPGRVEDRAAFAMASGCLIPAERLRQVGPMTEDFFIDYIDYDFSFRVRRAGYRIIVVGAASLKHRLGELREGRFLWRVKSYKEHSAKRRYTIYRNRIRVMIRHGFWFPEFVQFELLSVSKDFLQLLFWESGKATKLRAILAGIGDGILGRGGVRRG
jgi:GT2 family glycosyltransferase